MNLSIKMFDELFPPYFAGRTMPKGYFWKVVFDPTRNGEDPGLFYGSHFRLLDILPTWDETSPWPDGTVFEHIQTGQQLTFLDGQPHYLNYPKNACRLKTRQTKSQPSTPLFHHESQMVSSEGMRV